MNHPIQTTLEDFERALESVDRSAEMRDAVNRWGGWLYVELCRLGCSEVAAGLRCHAFGQRCWGRRRSEVQLIAEECLARFRSGVLDEPGETLGHELWQQLLDRVKGGAE